MVRFLLICLAFMLYTLIIIVVWTKISPYIPQVVQQSKKVVLGAKTIVNPSHKQAGGLIQKKEHNSASPTPTIH